MWTKLVVACCFVETTVKYRDSFYKKKTDSF